MNVLVMGSSGNMGRRYCAILRYLGHSVIEWDTAGIIEANVPRGTRLTGWDAAIIATPTDTHWGALDDLAYPHPRHAQRRSVLMEKPMGKTVEEVEQMFSVAEDGNFELSCVNQYGFLPEATRFLEYTGPTSYNYFNSGRDGLAFDCFQMFLYARAGVSLANYSVAWSCTINGVQIDQRGMDWAYVLMVSDFLNQRKNVCGKDAVLRATKKALLYDENGTYSGSGQVQLHAPTK